MNDNCIILYLNSESNHLVINCGGVSADLEENLSIDNIIKMRKFGISPLIIFEQILKELKNVDDKNEKDGKPTMLVTEYDEMLTKLIEFFSKVFQTANIEKENEEEME